MKKQRVTLYLDPHTWRAIRLYAVGHSVSASQFVENVVINFLLDTDALEQTKDPKRTPNEPKLRNETAQPNE